MSRELGNFRRGIVAACWDYAWISDIKRQAVTVRKMNRLARENHTPQPHVGMQIEAADVQVLIERLENATQIDYG